MRAPKAYLLAALILLAALVAGCSNPPAPDANQTPNDVRIIDPAAAFVAKTAVDWKSLGDAIAVIEVTGSREDKSAAGDPTQNGGTYGRIVDVSVDRVLWSRDAAHVPPDRFSMRAWGWVRNGNYRQAIVARGEPRFETGHSYLVALAKFPYGWGGLGSGAEAPFDDGTVGTGEWAGRDPGVDQPAIHELIGKNITQVQAYLDAVSPDPRSVQYGNLDPVQRAKKLGKAS